MSEHLASHLSAAGQDWEKTKERVVSHLGEIAQIFEKELQYPNVAQDIRAQAQALGQNIFRIMFMGEFKRGKSTLINAILGTEALPERVVEATAVVTLVRYGAVPYAEVHYENGRIERMTLDKFKEDFRVPPADSDSEIDRFVEVQHAVLYYPFDLCRDGLELVDTPGLGAHRLRIQRTYQFLPKADVIIFVLSAIQFFSQEEEECLEKFVYPLFSSNLFFVVNQWDLIEALGNAGEQGKRDLVQRIRAKLYKYCQISGRDLFSERVFCTSALRARKARMGQERLDLEETNVPALERAITKFLKTERATAQLRKIYNWLQTKVEDAKRGFDVHVSLLQQDLQKLETMKEDLESRLQPLRELRDRLVGKIEAHLLNFEKRFIEELSDWLRHRLPGQTAQKLEEVLKPPTFWQILTGLVSRKEREGFVKRHLEPTISRIVQAEVSMWHEHLQKSIVQ
ncbi:MAG: dynamin family protein, partial [Anaerolineales bacterium]|nr:dynamin family protein [Anaerolineales bacterium]MDW8447193.1 dynamin family protein [Anaerolineales bacterium]